MSLLDEMEKADTSGSMVDELNNIPDEEGEPWLPDEVGDGIEGLVLKRYSVTSDHKDAKTGEYPECPVVVLDVGGGELWKVTGYRSILRDEMEKTDPQPGDRFAAVYRGGPLDDKDEIKYHVYRAAVRKAAVTTSRPAAASGASNGAPANGAPANGAAARKPKRKPGQPKPKDDEPPY